MLPTQYFDVIDNNDDFIVINKYSNVDFHCSDEGLGIVAKVSQSLGGVHLFPVHRLDKMTSGLLVMAKSSAIAAKFVELFERRKVSKYYIAISDQKPKKKQGLIKGDMKKGRNGSYLLLKTNENPAITQFFSYSLAPNLRLFLLKPHTGKTHQLRVAMKSLGAPILGDSRYYPSNQQDDEQKIGHLHAWQLSFELNGQQFLFEAQPKWPLELVKKWLITNREMNNVKWPEFGELL